MPELHSFEYAVVRLVPRVERGEFLNVGVILFCKRKNFLQLKYVVNESRIAGFSDRVDIEEVRGHLRAFESVCIGGPDGGPIGALDIPSRFRWLTAQRSTIVQTSQVHPGLCEDPGLMLAWLYEQLVL